MWSVWDDCSKMLVWLPVTLVRSSAHNSLDASRHDYKAHCVNVAIKKRKTVVLMTFVTIYGAQGGESWLGHWEASFFASIVCPNNTLWRCNQEQEWLVHIFLNNNENNQSVTCPLNNKLLETKLWSTLLFTIHYKTIIKTSYCPSFKVGFCKKHINNCFSVVDSSILNMCILFLFLWASYHLSELFYFFRTTSTWMRRHISWWKISWPTTKVCRTRRATETGSNWTRRL